VGEGRDEGGDESEVPRKRRLEQDISRQRAERSKQIEKEKATMRVFISGMSGTLGTSLARLHHSRGDIVFGCSRNESKVVEWISSNSALGTLLVADCAALLDPLSPVQALAKTCDVLYHCAALKHVEIAEENPSSAYLQNVVKTMSVIQFCTGFQVPLVFISSDKACLPTSVYGATKLLAEKMVLRDGGAVVRLGNLIGSSGSVFEKWSNALRAGGQVIITDPEMTRFFVEKDKAAEFIVDQHLSGKIVFPHMRSAKMGKVAEYLSLRMPEVPGTPPINVVGLRSGETLHQWVAAPDDLVLSTPDRNVLGEGNRLAAGISSLHVKKWDTVELLQAAGIK
jgi:UDP-N-acetylglucosamine 4,6-dehydratase/5-epimerase